MMLKILIIEDSGDDLFFLNRTLRETGLEVEVLTAGDAVSGMEQIKHQPLDCIFLDYSIPGMNGLEFLRKVRSEKIAAPIIMLTGQKDEKIIVQLMKAGATDYISKNNLSTDTLRLRYVKSIQAYSEAIFDPFIDALETSLPIGLSFKGGLALFLKPIESFLEKFLISKTL